MQILGIHGQSTSEGGAPPETGAGAGGPAADELAAGDEIDENPSVQGAQPEQPGEIYSVYFSEIPFRRDGAWLILTDAPNDETGRAFVDQVKATLREEGQAPDLWVVHHERNETALHNRLRSFELIKAVIREYNRFSEAGWLAKLEQVVGFQYGLNVGFLRAGGEMIATLANFGYETSPLRWGMRIQSGAARTARVIDAAASSKRFRPASKEPLRKLSQGSSG